MHSGLQDYNGCNSACAFSTVSSIIPAAQQAQGPDQVAIRHHYGHHGLLTIGRSSTDDAGCEAPVEALDAPLRPQLLHVKRAYSVENLDPVET